ncbi:MAG: aromatic ring-hydroxylating dioxygenase subunit alpha [Chloroflexi bacterium]|nr:aromatic ring-hydroxylating dioxygenase subunit alpha [Chloroflexota bacterium]MYK35848.1 aromatic ring-hydroxylating dioxygenase subunit alpha [Chloroflexota bacterium]
MLTAAQNQRLTRVGPGTPMGELMRRYWHPIAPSAELNPDNPTKEVRILGEDLVLYRDAKGTLGLIEPSCAHRKANLSYGIPEENGIRCAYHGWIFNETGQCMDQPSEPEGSKFKDKVRIKAYPVQEKAGIVWAYMGPSPAPMLPRWDLLEWEGVERWVVAMELPCNWLQCMDNSLDPVHFEWLHNYWGSYVLGMEKPPEEREAWKQQMQGDGMRGRHEVKVGFDRFEYGVIKRRLMQGDTEENEWWRIGHPVLFPNILRVGQQRNHGFQMRTPMDDTHTYHIVLRVRVPEIGEDFEQAEIPYKYENVFKNDGRIRADWVLGQDQAAWIMQGPISDRTTEALGVTDVGIILYRKVLEEQMQIVEDGGEPMNVHREDKGVIVLPQEHSYYPGYDVTGGPFRDKPNLKPLIEAQLAPEIDANFA